MAYFLEDHAGNMLMADGSITDNQCHALMLGSPEDAETLKAAQPEPAMWQIMVDMFGLYREYENTGLAPKGIDKNTWKDFVEDTKLYSRHNSVIDDGIQGISRIGSLDGMTCLPEWPEK